MLKIGLINYLNAFPFSWPIIRDQAEAKNWRAVLARPGELNKMLAQGELDMSLVSAFEYLRNKEQYILAPGISLSSKGYVNSVKLVSKVPIEDLDQQNIYITSASATSISILKILLGEKNIHAKELINYDCHQGVPNDALAALTIGDEALTEDFSAFTHSWDLGAAWRELFQRDIVFALCVIRKDALEKYPKEIALLVKKLKDAPSESFACEETFAKNCRQTYPEISKPMTYLRNLHFECGEMEIANFNFYLKLCAKHKLIDQVFEAQYYTDELGYQHG
ncbi:menaquinone biosynthesis protein [Lentisphaera marina]|uniref:menaquinone biosynthetic enzyme MqnA/MqnD family protein n=1 Tax=Lentisphaera marina TaxID=1111041 RepID=UPI0023660DCA|nr:menaquinone biosynthesis protein [Lentisphaera marina]MDD7987032.1 menaquinone biosynthesis protein [Lentisphaera marina]